MSLSIIRELSNRYGADPSFVLAGGGNSSYKDEKYLYVKPSGVALAEIKEDDFVKMERETIRKVFSLSGYADTAEREAAVTKLMAFAVVGNASRRPSVEAPLHELMPFTFVVHLHPAEVNGLTCAKNGESECAKLFPTSLWIPETDPGFILAKTVHDANIRYKTAHGRAAQVIFLQNHGVFVGGNSPEEIGKNYSEIMSVLRDAYAKAGVSTQLPETEKLDEELAFELAPKLRGFLGENGVPKTVKCCAPFCSARGAFTPDHIVYAKSYALISDHPTEAEIDAFKAEHGYKPLVVEVPGKAVFCAGKTGKGAETVALLARDGALVQQLATAFGGPRNLSDAGRNFIENWEAESYRQKVSGGASVRLSGKVAVVTGGAQGFGYGIAEELAAEGATVVIADMNLEGAKSAASKLNSAGGASAVAVNIADETAVAEMVKNVVLNYGGIDLFVANAGVLKAGSVKSFEKRDWDFVTNINYSGYFLCVKHVSALMARQNACSGAWSDIVQVNSKSGLVGSNRNGAYAGGKFGTIGLTQSFALELVSDKIKVNSVCPGNFFDGPLWSDLERGLFVQYLNSGKVPGAKTIADVKDYYEKQIPMHRGCFPSDVAKAIIYAVCQSYETGQAIPVTGGQVMLN
ncbi:MAG: SDR family NAD(P)-dependent oxidoreductase [Victivallales bacterium]|jgi:NAD(P)-dependent dehydrogenase (short-subunit alcohol dehydrogenase family)/rhamnose utilization protein RhaD (predicted bifunctional aldolase and dehydrogenase)|nr:SDR family NAD(P)-dependent oxidoreductase [Victivallales bacterium]